MLTSGDGAELRQPLGITIAGGLVMSQLLTLYTTRWSTFTSTGCRRNSAATSNWPRCPINGRPMLMKHAATVRWQLWIVAFGFFMQTLDTTIVNTALPRWPPAWGEPAAHAVGDCLLCADGSGDAAGQRLAGGQGRRTAGVFSAIVLFTSAPFSAPARKP